MNEPHTGTNAAALIDFLRDRDVACPLCGYNLRQLLGSRCPECGRELELTVGVAEPYQSAWVALLVTTCMSGGLGFFITLATIKDGLPNWGNHPRLMTALWIFHMCMTVAAIAVVVGRRVVLRWRRPVQWWLFAVLTCVCAVAGGAMIVLEQVCAGFEMPAAPTPTNLSVNAN